MQLGNTSFYKSTGVLHNCKPNISEAEKETGNSRVT